MQLVLSGRLLLLLLCLPHVARLITTATTTAQELNPSNTGGLLACSRGGCVVVPVCNCDAMQCSCIGTAHSTSTNATVREKGFDARDCGRSGYDGGGDRCRSISGNIGKLAVVVVVIMLVFIVVDWWR